MNRLSEARSAEPGAPKARLKKARSVWLLWLIPAGAAALCVWFVYRDFVATGPLITIYFQNTDGIQEGNTPLQYLGAQVGIVKHIQLAEDQKRVKVTARLTGDASGLARGGSLFWVVRPELKVGTISGLGTIVSGNYINVQPGQGGSTNVFVAVEEAPPSEEPGSLLITIMSDKLESLEDRSPIFYRGLQVGEVLGCQLAENGRAVVVRARVHKEYAPLVRLGSQFWNAGGIDVRIGLFKGAEISAQSARTLFSGGIEFATPTDPGAAAANGAVFVLNDKPKEEWKKWAPVIALHLPKQAQEQAQTSGAPGPAYK